MQLLAFPVPELASLRAAVLGSTGGKRVTLPSGSSKILVPAGATAAVSHRSQLQQHPYGESLL